MLYCRRKNFSAGVDEEADTDNEDIDIETVKCFACFINIDIIFLARYNRCCAHADANRTEYMIVVNVKKNNKRRVISLIESSTHEFILFLIGVTTTAARRTAGGNRIAIPWRLVAAFLVEELCKKRLVSLVGSRTFARAASKDFIHLIFFRLLNAPVGPPHR